MKNFFKKEIQLQNSIGLVRSRSRSKEKTRIIENSDQKKLVKPQKVVSQKGAKANQWKNELFSMPTVIRIVTSQLQDPRRYLPPHNEKLNLVLDLDETLIYSTLNGNELNPINKNITYKILIQERLVTVLIRPYAKEMLKYLKGYYHLIPYSHGNPQYVNKILDILEEDEQLFRRDLMFKPKDTITLTSLKGLNQLALSDIEISKTLILDDQPAIWRLEDQSKIIPSKKFRSSFFENTEIQYKIYLKHKQNWGFIRSQFATENFESQSNQLKQLKSILKQIWREWTKSINNQQGATTEILLDQFKKEILKGYKISILSEDFEESQILKYLVHDYGAQVNKIDESQVIIIEEKMLNSINVFQKMQPLISLLTIDWMFEVFFNLQRPKTIQFYRPQMEVLNQNISIPMQNTNFFINCNS